MRATQAEAHVKASPRDADAVALYADALWSSGLFEEAEARYEEAVALDPELARGRHGRARALAARSKLDRGDGGSAGGAPPRAARSRDPPHHRCHLRADAPASRRPPVRSATTSICCRTRIAATRPTGRARRSSSYARSGSVCPFELDPGTENQTLHDRLPPGEREGHRPREDQRGVVPGLRRRHRRREHHPVRARPRSVSA